MDSALLQRFEVTPVFTRAEPADAGDDAAFVTFGGQSFDEQPIGFVTAAVCREIERILGQQDAHAVRLRHSPLSLRCQRAGQRSAGKPRRSACAAGVLPYASP